MTEENRETRWPISDVGPAKPHYARVKIVRADAGGYFVYADGRLVESVKSYAQAENMRDYWNDRIAKEQQ